MNLIQNKHLLTKLNKYMFTGNMFTTASKLLPMTLEKKFVLPVPVPLPVPATLSVPVPMQVPVQVPVVKKNTKPFVPFQKDKLFWCFYIILHGYEEYEMNHSNSFSVEKRIKIETVEKLKSIKEQLKELKLKRTELEDELVNKQMITVKGLCALCLVHNVSITYVFGRKYCEIMPAPAAQAQAPAEAQAPAAQASAPAANIKQGIIMQNEKKEDSLKWTTNEMNSNNNDFLTQIKADYWFIENIQKPLKAPSAYTLNELQDICGKLHITTDYQVNEKKKNKTKTALYEEILQAI